MPRSHRRKLRSDRHEALEGRSYVRSQSYETELIRLKFRAARHALSAHREHLPSTSHPLFLTSLSLLPLQLPLFPLPSGREPLNCDSQRPERDAFLRPAPGGRLWGREETLGSATESSDCGGAQLHAGGRGRTQTNFVWAIGTDQSQPGERQLQLNHLIIYQEF